MKIIYAIIYLCFSSFIYAEATINSEKKVGVSFGVFIDTHNDNEPLGFDCTSENEIKFKLGENQYTYDNNEENCYSHNIGLSHIIAWLPSSLILKANKKYNLTIYEIDIVNDDKYDANTITFTQEELNSIYTGKVLIKELGKGYFLGFNLRENGDFKDEIKKMITKYTEKTRGHSEKTRGHSEKTRGHSEKTRGHSEKIVEKAFKDVKTEYLSIDEKRNRAILKEYKALQQKGISKDLSKSLDKDFYQKLINAPAELAYMNYVISGLKNIQKGLKENRENALDKYINQTRYLMYAWTLPFEILGTDKLVENSLLGETKSFYAKEIKKIYGGYSQFVSTLLLQKIFTEFDSKLLYGGYGQFVSTLLLQKIFTEFDSKLLEDKVIIKNIISAWNKVHIPSQSNLFDIPLKSLIDEDIIDDPLNYHWYSILRVYMQLQDYFYQTKNEVNKIIKILEILPDTEVIRSKLAIDMNEVDYLYRRLDELARFNVIDVPVSIYADIYDIKFQKTKGLLNDDEEEMKNIAINFNKACANMQKYMVNEKTMDKVLQLTKKLKSEFDEDTEWKEVVTRAKLTQDWFNMLNKIKIKNK